MGTTRPFKFDPDKALEVFLYISRRAPVPDIYHVLKVLYFADRHHLGDYGRLICGDEYFALKDGPVPSGTYDLVRDVQDRTRRTPNAEKARSAFGLDGYWVKPLREPDVSFMSKSDLECINRAINEIGRLPFGRLKDLSHDAAYHSANLNGEISVETIAATLPDSEELIEELHS
jgi:uncharacterized phage-associated protein